MMNRYNKKRMISLLTGALAFLISISVLVSVTVVIFELVREKTEGNKVWLSLSLIGCILAITIACTIIDLFRRRIMIDKPVKEILNCTNEIINGNFNVELKTKHEYLRYDEFDIIKENLNKVGKELSKNEILKQDFISNVSHEIKTPISIIQNYASSIKGDNLTDEQTQYVDVIIQASKRLNSLVQNILKLNKLENQEIFDQKKEVILSESIAESILSFEDKIEEKRINLEIDLDEEIKIVSDRSFLEIIWNNLLSNAIKFTDEEGTIKVSLKKEDEFAVIKFIDNGIGISKENGERIFDKFYQEDQSHFSEGNGLGLALVKRVINIIGGEISVESTIKKGSTFSVKLRLK